LPFGLAGIGGRRRELPAASRGICAGCVVAVAENQRELCGTRGALDEIREGFGSTAITRGVLLGRDLGQPLRLLPD
jgi:hypothetical protein